MLEIPSIPPAQSCQSFNARPIRVIRGVFTPFALVLPLPFLLSLALLLLRM